ncbi:efflux transporter outer membrane subunit [Aquabacterium sp.]|uniref:efflux transporter outer membrane subunit n=1 Tax=Aquabacterium sp. TaxID=1872578 RepID=UPI003782E630
MSPRRMLARLVPFAVAALGAGCMSLAPEYQRPNAPVAAAYPGDATGTNRPAHDIEWQAFFADERLRRLIALALQNNRDLRVAAASIEQARAQLQVRRADVYPTVNVGAAAARQPSVVNGNENTSYSVGLTLSTWELDFFGRLRSLNDVALSQFYAAEESRKATQISLIAAVASAHLAIQADDELLETTRETLATREDSFRLTKLKFDHGAASELDLRQAESLLEGARVTLAQTRRQRALDENALVLLVGQSLPSDLPPALPLAQQKLLADVPAGLPSELLDRRPDVRQAERQLMAANANIGAARAALFPRITLTGSAGTASSELSGLFKSGSFATTVASQLLLPIFDAGRNQGNLQAAQAGRDIALAQYEKAIQSAFREVADALAGRATFGEQLRAQQAQAAAEEVRTRLADLRYRNGAASYLDVLDARRSLFAARQAVVQVQLQQAQNLVTLYKVLGGGWTDPVK